MTNVREMSDELRTALIHSGIDDPEEYLAHYGVAGMQWGVRKVEPRSTTTNKKGKPLSARKVRRNEIYNAWAKKVSKESTSSRDDRSVRTKKLGKAQVATMLGAFGTLGLSMVVGSPPLAAGAILASILLSGSSIVLDAKETNSAEKDLLRVYGN